GAWDRGADERKGVRGVPRDEEARGDPVQCEGRRGDERPADREDGRERVSGEDVEEGVLTHLGALERVEARGDDERERRVERQGVAGALPRDQREEDEDRDRPRERRAQVAPEGLAAAAAAAPGAPAVAPQREEGAGKEDEPGKRRPGDLEEVEVEGLLVAEA